MSENAASAVSHDEPSRRARFKAWAIGKVLIVGVSLGANVWTLAQQGMQRWLESLFQNGKLQVLWQGSASRTNVSVQAKTDRGDTIVLDMGERVSLPAGRYSLSVFQSGVELPISVQREDGTLSTHVEVTAFRTKVARVRFTPPDPPFAQIYDDVADHVGRPVSGGKRQPRVYQGFHEHGMMLWFSDQNRFLILQSGNAGTWSEISGPPYPTDPCLYKQDCVDTREKAPKNLHVPIGGGYLLWKERNLQRDLGFMTGYCIYWDVVMGQNFERGRLIGPVLPSPVTRIANALAIYTGKDRTSWEWAALRQVEPPDCHISND